MESWRYTIIRTNNIKLERPMIANVLEHRNKSINNHFAQENLQWTPGQYTGVTDKYCIRSGP